jgi:hypothetical protein
MFSLFPPLETIHCGGTFSEEKTMFPGMSSLALEKKLS